MLFRSILPAEDAEFSGTPVAPDRVHAGDGGQGLAALTGGLEALEDRVGDGRRGGLQRGQAPTLFLQDLLRLVTGHVVEELVGQQRVLGVRRQVDALHLHVFQARLP